MLSKLIKCANDISNNSVSHKSDLVNENWLNQNTQFWLQDAKNNTWLENDNNVDVDVSIQQNDDNNVGVSIQQNDEKTPMTQTLWLEEAEKWIDLWRQQSNLHDNPHDNPQYNENNIVKFFNIYTQFVKQLPDVEPVQYRDNTIRLVLNVMMKNEHPVMARSISSALPIVDAVCYSDTGSRGDVFEILRKTVPLEKPLCVGIEPWCNFGYNRSAGLEQTRRFVQRMGWDPTKTFILCIDADMTLTITPDFVKGNLSKGCYNLQQHNGASVYSNSRIFQVSHHWTVVGRTHEFYRPKIETDYELLSSLYLNDLNDGMNRSDKIERDMVLLMEDLIDDPKNQRSMFYLGESYRNRGHKDKNDYQIAISWYQRHIKTGSFDEEVWFSHYAIGMCYESLKETGNMLEAFMKAYQLRPWRAEPLYHIARYYKNASQNEHWNAMIYFKQVSEMPFPHQDVLFIDKDIYNFHNDNDMCISAFYTNEKRLGYKSIQRLLRNVNVPDYIISQAHYNARFYLKPLPNTVLQQIQPDFKMPYKACNPSLYIDDQCNMTMICRSVNYSQNKARNYQPPPNSGVFDTQNMLMQTFIDGRCSFNINCFPHWVVQIPITSNIVSPYVDTCKVRGLEDARIVKIQDRFAFSCTSLEHTADNSPRMVWVEFDGDSGQVQSTRRITGFEDNRVQKNWLPFVRQDQVFFIYNYAPTVQILKFDINQCTVEKHYEFSVSVNSKNWRGSCGPILIPNYGSLVLVHEVCDRSEGRHYMHRFVLFNQEITEYVKSSDLFYFKHGDGVEMSIGMAIAPAISNLKERVYITVGIEDREAWIVMIESENLKNFIDGEFH
jgi:tetratricopeptide (TPR) repeat protein